MIKLCKPGDILLYSHRPTIVDRLIETGEYLEDGLQEIEFYHVAVALGQDEKIETTGYKVHVSPIDYENCTVFRPPYDLNKLAQSLAWSKKQLGRLYGWIGVIDQALRDLSRGHIHFPRWFILWSNQNWPYCSTLAARIMVRAGFNIKMKRLNKPTLRKWPPPSPEDIYLAVKEWRL